MRRSIAAAFVVASALVACSLLTDLSDLGGGADGAGDACEAPGRACVPSPPTGWTGPFWIYYGDPASRPAACPSAAPSVVVSGNDTLLDASVPCGNATCAATCGTSITSLINTCGAVTVTTNVSGPFDGGCYSVTPTFVTNSSWEVELQNPGIASCAFTAKLSDAATTSWKAAMLGCSSDAATSCGGQTCLPMAPIPFEGKACVFKPGVSECPGAPYSQLRSSTLFESAPASCKVSACGCSPNVFGQSCTVEVDYVGTSPTCGPPNADAGGGDCVSSPAPGVGYLHATRTPPSSPSCSVPDGSPPCNISGQVTPQDQFTVCCMP